ncbi:MAG: prepilin-type N-terminal cleavage/methylation domain-containing protein, partial [Verrucomicrobia bacterium]|nr:prepilin-type N-terminal cleavage/methylation domain-containing protein [Verrucomicrobiota bacterium]
MISFILIPAKPAKCDRLSVFPILKFRIPHFAFPNKIPPFRPLLLYPGSVGAWRPLRESSAFTLVELMAVIGIIALLAVVGVPAIKGLTGSGGRKQALGQLVGALEVARNTALSTGTNAAVIFPDSTFTSGDAYKYRSMAVVSYKDSTIATNTNSTIPYDKLVTSWIVLPQGISFLPNYLVTTTTTNMISVTASIQIPPKTNSTSITCPGIIFQPDGGLLDVGTNSIAGVGFFEGTVDASGKTNPTSKMTNFETVRLTRYTGRTIPTLAPAP